MRNNKYLFLFTLTFFTLGFVNIHFALLGFICMTLPIILLIKNQRKTWCQGYCPRSSLYTTIGKTKKWKSRNTPGFFIKGNMKWIMLLYFGISLSFITLSTIAVARGIKPAMEIVRFLIIIPIPFRMPQLIDIIEIAPWVTHLSYRFYSMMMTTTILGLVLGLLYKPRTWCTVCPIATISDVLLKK
ncbi:hypothetical protein [Anaerocolumna sp.]|jgi:hypothetical protein|uniref:hypothetical protein n=1 Tax=Anaerocolumna sp. TaxID=2041569 RepID=UPI0028A9A26B|nr:hypothetical protein [Anaerocolumna sp.]